MRQLAAIVILFILSCAPGCARPPMTSEPFASSTIAPLASAVANGDAAEIRRQLEAGADPQTPGSDGASLLVWAIDRGLVDSVDALLEGGADPNHADADGKTPVHAAAFADDPDLLRTVLDSGYGPPARSPATAGTGWKFRPPACHRKHGPCSAPSQSAPWSSGRRSITATPARRTYSLPCAASALRFATRLKAGARN